MSSIPADLKQLGQKIFKFLQTKQSDVGLIVRVESAIALNSQQKTKLKQVLQAKLNQDITIENQVNSAVIAGLRIRFKDKLIDTSIKTKLERLQEALQND